MRTAVHAEVVRALERLTALPLSGQLAQGGSKHPNSSNGAAGGAQTTNSNHALGVQSAKADSSPRAASKSPRGCEISNGTASSPQHADAASPRKKTKAPPHNVSNGVSAPTSDGATRSSEVMANGGRKIGKEGGGAAVIFMDKGSARAHADAITSHTFKAFKRVRSSLCRWPAESGGVVSCFIAVTRELLKVLGMISMMVMLCRSSGRF